MKSPTYIYKGASALVQLHEENIKAFFNVWKQAKQRDIKLPETDDPDYESLETLLFHVLRSAGGYMRWICQKLELQDPQINQVPSIEVVENEAEGYIDHLIERWNWPLTLVEEAKFFDKVYKSNWGADYCIEAMLEHAVMHPKRHEFQLKNLIMHTI